MVFQSAEWIWLSQASTVNQYALFRADFCAKGACPASLRISADARYVAWLNGAFLEAGQYADYPVQKIYDEIALDGLLKPGANRLEIGVHSPVTDSSVYAFGAQAVIFEVLEEGACIARSGKEILASPMPGYVSGPVDLITGQMGYSFEYDARFIPEVLEFAPAKVLEHTRAFAENPVRRVRIGERSAGNVVSQGVFFWPQNAKTLGQRMQYAAMAFRENRDMSGLAAQPSIPCASGIAYAAEEGDGIYVLLDLGRETVGYLDIEIDLPAEAEILIGWGEHTDDLRLRTYVGTRNFAARYQGKAGHQRFTHFFRRLGLRYVQLFVAARAFRLVYAGVLPTDYPLRHSPALQIADSLHARIAETCAATLRHCMHEHYEDCPWREQALYAMDSRNQMLCGYYAFGEYAMPRASLKLLSQSLRADGMLELCAPARIPITIPSFTAMFLVELQEYVLYSGDLDFGREMLPCARAIADAFCAHVDESGLIPAYRDQKYWNFYEWQPYLEGYATHERDTETLRYDAPLNCFVSLGLDRLAALMSYLGENGVAYARCAQGLKAAVDARFWDEEAGLYHSFANSQGQWHEAELTQALAAFCGACPERKLDRVLSRLADESLVPVTLAYSIFQFEALLMRPEKWSRWVFGRIARDWGHMLHCGATTFWETLKGAWDFDRAGSLCHGWSAIPIYLYFAYALGLKPLEPGFSRYSLERVDAGLGETSGMFVLPDGKHLEL